MMQPDDDLCLCFHVTRRKVENYLRVEQPASPSQLAECYGAGTGCGWCRPFLRRLFDAHRAKSEAGDNTLPDSDEYRAGRTKHVNDGAGTPPPGATPID
jgi:bacterioferritin-associated ferredoxin